MKTTEKLDSIRFEADLESDFNWYSVEGLKYVDMCGNHEYIPLGIVQLNQTVEYFRLKRPAEVGHFIFNNERYSTFIFTKVNVIKFSDLTNFK